MATPTWVCHGRVMRSSSIIRRGSLVLVPAMAVVGLASCSPDPKGGAGDAPIAAVEQEPWTILNNVDGFPNIATRCRSGSGIYVTRSAGDNSDTLVVLPNDPACAPGASTTGTSVPR